MTEQPTAAARLNHLHAISGFDWGLIANLTRVSLNAVHRCLNLPAAPFPARAAERLNALITVVESSPATTPEGRDRWMRESIVDGRTRIEWFAVLGRRNRIPLQGPGYTPAQLLGAVTDHGGQTRHDPEPDDEDNGPWCR